MDLLERSESLDALFRLAAEAATGSGRLALIGGEAGVGKTALIWHFSRAVSREIRVVCGGCDPLSLPRPLGPLLDMAPQLGGGVRRLIAEEAPAARLFSALLELLTAAPHVLVFDACSTVFAELAAERVKLADDTARAIQLDAAAAVLTELQDGAKLALHRLGLTIPPKERK